MALVCAIMHLYMGVFDFVVVVVVVSSFFIFFLNLASRN